MESVEPGPPEIGKFPIILTLFEIVKVLLLAKSTTTFPVNDAEPLAMLLHSANVAPPEGVQVIEVKLILLEMVVGLDVQVF